MRWRAFPSPAAAGAAVAELIARRAREAVAARGRFVWALTGGRSVPPLYASLAAAPDELPWAQTHVCWTDERCVPADSPLSNARLARSLLLDHVPVPAAQVHAVPAGAAAADAARRYEADLRALFRDAAPRCDAVLLSLGDDGHLASLFPGDAALAERVRWAVGVERPAGGPDRVSLTLPVLNAGRTVAVLVFGASKGGVLRRALREPGTGADLPARLLAPEDGDLTWFLDADAAASFGQAAAGRA